MNGKPNSPWTRTPEDMLEKPSTPEERAAALYQQHHNPICPLHHGNECEGQRCAWFDLSHSNCGVLGIARNLDRVAHHMEWSK